MIRRFRRRSVMLVAALLPATAGFLPAAAPAQAQADTPSRSVLELTVTDGEQPDPSTAHSVVLTCEPPGGSHPDAATACKQLDEVDGHFESLNVHPTQVCTLVYLPVTATAGGTWRGRPVTFQHTYPNRCDMLRRADAVFDF